MPFRLRRGAETLAGKLVLEDRDPLPLLIDAGVCEEDAITSWIFALLGFADATCIELGLVKPTSEHESKRPQLPSAHSKARRPHPARGLPRHRPWPSHLEPVGHWTRYGGAFVAGHRRHLGDDKTASTEARGRALDVGIILETHETWVRPYARGIPLGIEIRFRWHAPI